VTRTRQSSAFYMVADSRHYVGLVALINSLRLVGHDEPIYVGDCGLAPVESGRLAEHVTLVPAGGAKAPHLVKTVAPLTYPADVLILVDTDVIVTRPLTPLIDSAGEGKLVAFADRVSHRFDAAWSGLLELGELRRQPYVNSGLVLAERGLGTSLLEHVAAGCDRVEVERTVIGNGTPDYPFYYLDQDVFNALLATYPPEQLKLVEHRLAPFPPFPGLTMVDEATLRCSYDDGGEPFALHHITRKPWLTATRWNLYSRLLARLVLAEDAALRLRSDELPLRLRPGRIAWLEKRRSNALAAIASTRGRLGLRRRLAERLRGD
jgi:hypothetical protein